MHQKILKAENKLLFCICPQCKTSRRKIDGAYNIIKRGYERNGIARFFCRPCRAWFNEETGNSMKWLER